MELRTGAENFAMLCLQQGDQNLKTAINPRWKFDCVFSIPSPTGNKKSDGTVYQFEQLLQKTCIFGVLLHFFTVIVYFLFFIF